MQTLELILTASVFLGIFQLLLATMAKTACRGTEWNFSSRDAEAPPLTGKTARIDRALQNFKETFPFFLAGIFLVLNHQNFASDLSRQISEISAGAYLAARLIYLPLYVFDITRVRSLIWIISLVAIAGLFFSLFV